MTRTALPYKGPLFLLPNLGSEEKGIFVAPA